MNQRRNNTGNGQRNSNRQSWGMNRNDQRNNLNRGGRAQQEGHQNRDNDNYSQGASRDGRQGNRNREFFPMNNSRGFSNGERASQGSRRRYDENDEIQGSSRNRRREYEEENDNYNDYKNNYENDYEDSYDEQSFDVMDNENEFYDEGNSRNGRLTRGFSSHDEDEPRETSRKNKKTSTGILGRGQRAGKKSTRKQSGTSGSAGRSVKGKIKSAKGKSLKKSKSGISRRGFASMDPEEVRRIASMGGRAAHEYGTAHEFNSREARAAGKKGGKARWA
jgi:uncharacterized protein